MQQGRVRSEKENATPSHVALMKWPNVKKQIRKNLSYFSEIATVCQVRMLHDFWDRSLITVPGGRQGGFIHPEYVRCSAAMRSFLLKHRILPATDKN